MKRSNGQIRQVRVAALQSLFKVLASSLLAQNEQVSVEEYFLQLLGMFESENESTKMKHTIIQELTFYVLLSLKQLRDAHAKPDTVLSPLSKYILRLRGQDKEMRVIVDRLWTLMQTTNGDYRFRADLMKLYFAIWGRTTPNCYLSNEFYNVYILDEKPVQNFKEHPVILMQPLPAPHSNRPTEVISLDQTPPPQAPPKKKKSAPKRKLEDGAPAPPPKKKKAPAPPPISIIKSDPVLAPVPTPTGDGTATPATAITEAVTPATATKNTIKFRVNTTVPPASTPKPKSKPKPSKKKVADDEDDDDVDDDMEIFNAPVATEMAPVSKPKLTQEMKEQVEKEKKLAEEDAHSLEKENKKKIMDEGQDERVIMIHFVAPNIRYYCKLYFTTCATHMYHSLPIHTREYYELPGMIWFSLPGVEPINLDAEPHCRDIACKNEIAYWKGGNALIMPHGKTSYTLKNEVRLSEKCFFVGTFLYDYKKFAGLPGEVRVERPRRIVLTVPNTLYSIDMDLYVNDAANLVYDTILQPVRSTAQFYGKMLYFGIGKQSKTIEPEKNSTSDSLFRDYMHYGEIAYWCEQSSNVAHILVGTGATSAAPVGKKNSNLIQLNEKCYIIGRIASRKSLKDVEKEIVLSTALLVQRRQLHLTIEGADSTTTFVGYFYETTTADQLYKLLPIKNISMQVVGTAASKMQQLEGSIASSLTEDIKKEPGANDVIEYGELAFNIETSSIVIYFGNPMEKSDEKPPATCNIFARLDVAAPILPDFIYNSSSINITLQNLSDVSKIWTESQQPVPAAAPSTIS